jgi:hypothetical protein
MWQLWVIYSKRIAFISIAFSFFFGGNFAKMRKQLKGYDSINIFLPLWKNCQISG